MRFFHQFEDAIVDVTRDLPRDMLAAIEQVDPKVTAYLRQALGQVLATCTGRGDSPDRIVDQMVSGSLVMFFVGRRHALQGYPTPLPADEGPVSEVPADLSSLDSVPQMLVDSDLDPVRLLRVAEEQALDVARVAIRDGEGVEFLFGMGMSPDEIRARTMP